MNKENDFLVICDADGALTDNTVLVTGYGMHRKFNMYDVEAFWKLKKLGFEIGILTGSPNEYTKKFGAYYGIPIHVSDDKMMYLANNFPKYFDNNSIISFANDTMDLEMMECSFFTGCPFDAWDDILEYTKGRMMFENPSSAYITRRSGGNGAFREFIEHYLLRIEQGYTRCTSTTNGQRMNQAS